MPDEFIPLAEATGLIDAITGQVLDRGLRWLASDPASAGLSLSVNLSAKSLVNVRLAADIAALCRQFTIDPARLIMRSEQRRVGKACVSPCRSRWSPYH